MKKLAVVLFNLGGPDKPEDIRPFLKNLFSDKAIIDLPLVFRFPLSVLISTFRAPKAKPLYEIMGGASPLLKNTKKQANALKAALEAKYLNTEIKIIISMRYWHPFSNEAAKELTEFNADEVILLPLYPHYSRTTTGSSIKEFQKYYKNKARIIREYYLMDGFVNSVAKNIIAEYENIGSPEKVRILFSAHGLPQKIVDAGDPYEKQIRACAAKISGLLPNDFEKVVCFQSKVGPMKWLEPSTVHEIERAGVDNIPIIICPIAFVSDHIETLVELDFEYRKLAESLNIPKFGRSKTVGTDSDFINGLVGLIDDTLKNKLDKS